MCTLNNIRELVEGLKHSNNNYAYRCLKQLEDESINSSAVYPFFKNFVNMLDDDKAITARQCIKVLPLIVKYKPDLKNCIVNELHNANTLKYKDSMQALILKDIQNSLEVISKY